MINENEIIIKNVFWKFSERMLAQLISFIVSIVLARLLFPEAYGTIALMTVFISFLDILVTNGLPIALIQKIDTDELDFSSVFYFNSIFSIFLYILLFYSAPSIASFYSNDELILLIRVMGIRIVIASLNSVQHSYVSKHMMFKKYFWSTFFGTVLSGLIGILLAINGFGVWALVAQYMTNTVVDTIVLWFTVRWRPILNFSWNRIRRMISFGWKILVESISENFSVQIRGLIIGKVYSPGDLAYYNKAQQMPDLLIKNIAVSISSVLLPSMSNNQNKEGFVLSLLRKSTKVASYVLFPLITGLALVASPLIRILLTEKWIECVPYMQIFCITQGATIGMITRHQALNSIGRSDVYMIEHIAYRIFFLTIIFSIYRTSVIAIALSGIAGAFFMTLTVMYTSKRYNGYLYKDQILDILPTLIGCLLMSIPVWLIQNLNLSDMITLILQIGIGSIIYIGYSAIFKIDSFLFFKNNFILFFRKAKGLLR